MAFCTSRISSSAGVVSGALSLSFSCALRMSCGAAACHDGKVGYNSVMGGLAEQQGWLAQFKEYENIQELTRRAVVSLIEYVRVNEDKEIEVRLMHGDRFASIVDFLSEQKEKEAAKRIIHLTREAV